MPKYLDETGLAHYHGNVEKRPVQTFETVAAMQAARWLKAGMTCHTNGFHASGDGGAAYYTVSASGTANGMDVLACTGGLVAMHVPTSGWISVKQYGARGNGSYDDAAVIQAALDSDANVYFPRGTYVVKSALTVGRSKRISGDTRGKTVLAFNNGTDGFVVNSNGVSFDNLSINGGSYSAGGAKSGIHFTASTPYFEVNKVNVFSFNKAIYSETFVGSIINCVANDNEYGFYLTGGPNIHLSHCYALDCLTGYYVAIGYSLLSGCACDRANIAYHIDGGLSLSVNNCGCEFCGTYMVVKNLATVTVTGGASHSYQRTMTPSHGANDFVIIRSQCIINGYHIGISGMSADEATVYSCYVEDSTVFMTGCVFQLPAYVSDDSSVYGYELNDTNLITDATFVSKDTWTLTDSRWATYFDMPSSLVVGDVYEISCNIKKGDQTAEINASKWLSGEIDGASIDFGGRDIIDTNKSVQAYRFEVTETMANATKTRFYLRSSAGQPWYRRNWQCIKLPHKYTTAS